MATKNKSRNRMHPAKLKGKTDRKLTLEYKRKKLVASKEAHAYLVPAILEVPLLITQTKVTSAEQVCVQPTPMALQDFKKRSAIHSTEIKPLINAHTFIGDKPASNIDFNQSWLKFRKRMRSRGYDF